MIPNNCRDLRVLKIERPKLSRVSPIRTSWSPSPRPSPQGKGALFDRSRNHRMVTLFFDGKMFTLSPRERAGVRGKFAFNCIVAGRHHRLRGKHPTVDPI